MNFNTQGQWLIASPHTTDDPCIQWVRMQDIERIKVMPKTTQAGAQICVFVSGKEIMLKTGYFSNDAAVRDANELLEAIAEHNEKMQAKQNAQEKRGAP
jgi:hypothetical protein